jgi:hypothetical protein
MSDKVVYRLAANVAELDKMVENAIASANTMRKRVQVVAIAILAHAEKHGDYTRAQTLIEGLGHGVNMKALVEFFVRFGGLVVDSEEGGFCDWKGSEYIRENFQNAKATMWWELKPQNPWQGFDLETELVKLIKRAQTAEKRIEKLPDDSPDRAKFSMEVNDATLQSVVSLCNFEAIVDEAA